jgi:hypothetical protein
MAFRSDEPPESMVVEDGTGDSRARPKPKSGWILAAVGFGLGLALGTLIAAPRGTPIPVGTTEPTAAETTTSPPADADGVSGAVPGFPDALVAVGSTVGSGHDYLLWPVGGPLITRSMTGGRDVRLDVRGQFIALSDVVPDQPGSLLSMGRYNSVRIISSGVTSYAWHDSSPGNLAYTTEVEGEWRLNRVRGGFDSSLVAAGSPGGGTVAAWGEWGFAVQLPDDRVQLLTSSGEPRDTVTGMVLASHESGWVLVEDGGLKLVSAGGGVRRLDSSDLPQTILAASFSPDGSQVAVADRGGVIVHNLSEETETTAAPRASGNWVAWSSDSRFVVSPAPRGLFIFDLANSENHQVLVGHSILAAQVSPLSAS